MGRALALEPKLLLLDEPISGLTSEEKEEAAYRITEIRGRFKITIILVEHDLKIASPWPIRWRPSTTPEDRPGDAGGGPAESGSDPGLRG